MGNQQSSGAKKDGKKNNTDFLAEYVNTIASKLIREQSFHDMKNLIDSKKCDNLVIITADIFEKYFTGNQVTYLDHRIKDGQIDNNAETALNEEEILYFKKKNMSDIDVDTQDKRESVGFKKRRICIGLAKYYIKIAHLFAAIRTTINEEYIKEERRDRDRDYDDRREREYDERYEDYYRKRYGGGSEPFGRLSLCGRRLVALLHKRKGKNGEYIAPQFCSSEYKNRIQTLDDELGIPELEALYNNQYEYDVSNKDWKKQFTGRDKKMDQEYKKDLTELYNQMTANTGSLPAEIKNFKDVPLEMEKETACIKSKEYKSLHSMFLYKRGDELVENEFLSEYTEHIKKMEDEIQKKNGELIEILKSIFKKKSVTPQEGEEDSEESYRIMIDPELTYVKLQEIVEKTRKIIVKMYLDCDKNYKKGIEIYVKMLGSKAVQESEEDLKLFSGDTENVVVESAREYEEERKQDHRDRRDRYDDRDRRDRYDDRDRRDRYDDRDRHDDYEDETDEYGYKKDSKEEIMKEEQEIKDIVRVKNIMKQQREDDKYDNKREYRYGGNNRNKTLKKRKNKNKNNKTKNNNN